MAFIQNNTSSDPTISDAYRRKPQPIIIQKELIMEGGKFQDALTLLYGAVKIGKTKMASRFPGVYFIKCEPGQKWVKIRGQHCPDWTTFLAFLKSLEQRPQEYADVKCFCIDTVTNLAKYCMQYICSRERITHPSDLEWGKGWEAFSDQFMEGILKLTHFGRGIIFIAHESTTEIISRRMKITKQVPDMPKSSYRIINNLVDTILYVAYVDQGTDEHKIGEKRCIFTKPSEVHDAGDRTGKLPNTIEFKTEGEAVLKILRCYKDEE